MHEEIIENLQSEVAHLDLLSTLIAESDNKDSLSNNLATTLKLISERIKKNIGDIENLA